MVLSTIVSVRRALDDAATVIRRLPPVPPRLVPPAVAAAPLPRGAAVAAVPAVAGDVVLDAHARQGQGAADVEDAAAALAVCPVAADAVQAAPGRLVGPGRPIGPGGRLPARHREVAELDRVAPDHVEDAVEVSSPRSRWPTSRRR